MTINEIANQLADLCRKGDWGTIYQNFYAPNARSIEPEGVPGEREVQGMEAFQKKGEAWQESIETFHFSEIGEPVVAGNHFALPWKSKITFKGAPGPVTFEELAVYEVKDGKIVKEQFFYDPQM